MLCILNFVFVFQKYATFGTLCTYLCNSKTLLAILKVRDGEISFRYCHRNIPRAPGVVWVSTSYPPYYYDPTNVPFGVKRRSCPTDRGFPLMIPANENDWQLKYDRLVLWRNATWRRTDKGIDPNVRTISVRSPFPNDTTSLYGIRILPQENTIIYCFSALIILLEPVCILRLLRHHVRWFNFYGNFLFLYGYNLIFF